MKLFKIFSSVLILTMLISGCGGGGSSDDNDGSNNGGGSSDGATTDFNGTYRVTGAQQITTNCPTDNADFEDDNVGNDVTITQHGSSAVLSNATTVSDDAVESTTGTVSGNTINFNEQEFELPCFLDNNSGKTTKFTIKYDIVNGNSNSPATNIVVQGKLDVDDQCETSTSPGKCQAEFVLDATRL